MQRIKQICLIVLVILIVVPIMISAFWHLYVFVEYRNIELYSFPAEEVSAFSIDDYQSEIEVFTSDENVGPITGVDDVVEKAQRLWNEEFCVITIAGLHEPNPGDGVEVFFDSENVCWLIRGTIPTDSLPSGVAGWLGVLPNAIICENGDVLAMWQG